MNKNELTPGTKVIAALRYPDEYDYDGEEKVVKYSSGDSYDETLEGVVVDKPAAKGKVFVQWDDVDEPDEVDVKVLSPISAKSDLEKEFKETEKAIKEKMKAAAALVKEANKMAQKAGVRNLAEMQYGAAGPLVDAMDNSGWRSSSWGC
jgi:hypothetical protein